MNLSKTIAELYEERMRLDLVIASLQQFGEFASAMPKSTSRRGRKFMSQQERQEVSERMRRYWARRKAAQQLVEPHALTASSAA